MKNMNFICPTCKRPTHPDDNEIIEYLTKEKDRYRDFLGERTKELERTREALDVAVDALKYANKCIKGGCVNWETEIDKALDEIKTALEQKDVK